MRWLLSKPPGWWNSGDGRQPSADVPLPRAPAPHCRQSSRAMAPYLFTRTCPGPLSLLLRELNLGQSPWLVRRWSQRFPPLLPLLLPPPPPLLLLLATAGSLQADWLLRWLSSSSPS